MPIVISGIALAVGLVLLITGVVLASGILEKRREKDEHINDGSADTGDSSGGADNTSML